MVLLSHVVLHRKAIIESGTRIESGTCIGVTGIVWTWGFDGEKHEMAQLGGVRIGRNCLLGSNISIVRGSINDTIIEGSSNYGNANEAISHSPKQSGRYYVRVYPFSGHSLSPYTLQANYQ